MNKSILVGGFVEAFFEKYLVKQKNATLPTVRTYRDAIKLLLIYASDCTGKSLSKLTLEDLPRHLILDFLDYLENERSNKVRSRNARLMVIRSFFRYVAYMDPAKMSLADKIITIPSKRTNRSVVPFLLSEEVKDILAVPDRNTISGRRDYLLLTFMLQTGVRVSEACNLKFEFLRLISPYQVKIIGKGQKERVMPLTAEVVKLIQDANPAPQPNDYVFKNQRGGKISRYGIAHIIKETVKIAAKKNISLGKKVVSPHVLRHTTGMFLLWAKVDLTTIASWLGHESIETTNIYVEADIKMKEEALAKCKYPETTFMRYKPGDELLSFLESL